MQITIDRSALLTALTRLNGIVPRRSTIPILSSFLLHAEGDTLTVRGTSLDMEATVTAPAAVSMAGRTCVSADTLLGIAKTASEGADITMKLGERLAVSSGRSHYKIKIEPPADFPIFSLMEPDAHVLELTGAQVASLFGRVAYAMGTDAARAILQSATLQAKDGALMVTASGGQRLARMRIDFAAPAFTVVVPDMAVREIVALSAAETVTVRVGAQKIQLETDDGVFTSKLLDGGLDMQRAIPADHGTIVRVDRDRSITALRRLGVALDGKSRAVKLKVADNLMTVTARSPDIEASDEFEVEYDGDEILMAVNADFLIDAISAVGGDFADVGFSALAFVVTDPLDETILGVVAPLKA